MRKDRHEHADACQLDPKSVSERDGHLIVRLVLDPALEETEDDDVGDPGSL